MIASLPLLFAAPPWNELISILVGLAFLVMWVIGQINEAKKKQAAEAIRQPGDVPPQPVGQMEMAREAPQAPPDPLRAQIDEFLRRAGQPSKPAPAVPPQQPAGHDDIVVLLDESVTELPRKPLADSLRSMGDAAAAARGKPTKPSQPPREQQPRPQRVKSQRGSSVAEHVAERVGAASQEFRKEVANLGERVKQADEQFDRQLHEKFDHQLGTLGDRTASRPSAEQPATETKSPAGQIAALLASPDGVRQAIVLNEVLRRPVDRW